MREPENRQFLKSGQKKLKNLRTWNCILDRSSKDAFLNLMLKVGRVSQPGEATLWARFTLRQGCDFLSVAGILHSAQASLTLKFN